LSGANAAAIPPTEQPARAARSCPQTRYRNPEIDTGAIEHQPLPHAPGRAGEGLLSQVTGPTVVAYRISRFITVQVMLAPAAPHSPARFVSDPNAVPRSHPPYQARHQRRSRTVDSEQSG